MLTSHAPTRFPTLLWAVAKSGTGTQGRVFGDAGREVRDAGREVRDART